MKEKYVIIGDEHGKSIEPVKDLLLEKIIAGDTIINLMDSDSVKTTRFFYLLNNYYNHNNNLINLPGNHEEGTSKSLYEIFSKLTGRDFNIYNADWLNTYFSDKALPAADYVKAVNKSIKSGLQIEKPTFGFKTTNVPDFNFMDLFKQMIKDESFYFIDDLVRKAEKDYANKEYPALNMGGRKIMALHGSPVQSEDWPIGVNPLLWNGITIQSRLHPTRTEERGLNPVKVLKLLEYLKQKDYLGIIRGHDHEPALFILSNKMVEHEGEPAFVLRVYDKNSHRFYYITEESIEEQIIDRIPIVKRELPRIFDKQFIFCPGPYQFGFYATASASEKKGIKFRIHNINQKDAPHTKYQMRQSEPEFLSRKDFVKV